jgi:hypothetical protein
METIVTFMDMFLPDTSRIIHHQAPWLIEALFPKDSLLECPWPAVDVPSLGTIQQPSLMPIAMCGIFIGLLGFGRLQIEHLWRRAFLWFGFMNITAIVCHSFVSSASPLKPLVLGLDVGCTCSSSLLLIAASTAKRSSVKVSKALNSLSNWAPFVFLAIAVLGNYIKAPFTNELMYVATTIAAMLVLFVQEVLLPLGPAAGRGWLQACSIAAAPGLLSPLLFKQLCGWFGPHFSMIQVLFLACDIAFLCLYQSLRAYAASKRKKMV